MNQPTLMDQKPKQNQKCSYSFELHASESGEQPEEFLPFRFYYSETTGKPKEFWLFRILHIGTRINKLWNSFSVHSNASKT